MLMDTTREIEELQNRLWMEKSVSERAEFMFDMFAFGRRVVLTSLPKGLSDRELKAQVYFRTYGRDLDKDFLKDAENDAQ